MDYFFENQNDCNIKKAHKHSIHYKILLFYIMNFIKILILFNPILSLDDEESNYSFITLKINKTGNIKLFYSGENALCSKQNFSYPDMIQINGINLTYITSEYEFNTTENIIKLIWKKAPLNIECLFYYCSDIIEIDFSNFDSSNIKKMNYMFYSCTSLISINFDNFITSNVVDMNNMFCQCMALPSLNLSGFDTSMVENMDSMFSICSVLSSLD